MTDVQVVAMLGEVATLLKKTLDLQNLITPKGGLYYIPLSLTGGATLTQIDLLKGLHTGLPANTNFKIPFTLAYSIEVVNDGNGDINFGIPENTQTGDTGADVVLHKNERLKIEAPRGTLRYVNVVAPTAGSNATVRIFVMN